jgi:hypothetical protein
MADLDDELIARAIRWCSEAGRPPSAHAVRTALAPLSWDQLLSARALLADAPPARPLGPFALADLARGAPLAEATRREREGGYGDVPGATEAAATQPSAPRSPRAPRGRKAQGPIVRRARDRSPATPSQPRAAPLLDALFESEGRAVLGRLLREHGARRAAIVAALARGWRRADGTAPGEGDLDALLEAHGLARAFASRERDELLHALRAAGGSRRRAAEALGLAPAALEAALARLGAAAAAEVVRDVKRAELRRRATLSERVRLVIEEADLLTDLGLLDEVEADLRARLPEHVRALRASGAAQLGAALARSLGAPQGAVEAFASRVGLDVGPPPPPARREPPRRDPRRDPRRAAPAPAQGRPRPAPARGAARGPRPPKPGRAGVRSRPRR